MISPGRLSGLRIQSLETEDLVQETEDLTWETEDFVQGTEDSGD